jgi:hypothetical protein
MAQLAHTAQHGPQNNAYWGDAAPTSGNYKDGDIMWNIAPASGGPAYWVCTTASVNGNGGTWSASANLA